MPVLRLFLLCHVVIQSWLWRVDNTRLDQACSAGLGCHVESSPFYPYRFRRRYKESDGVNADHTWVVTSHSIGKCKNDQSPYLIANEWIAAQIGHFLRLPIPPCSLLRKKTSSTVMFASQRYENISTPACKPALLYQSSPELCAGVVAFDILIANRDRGKWNIKVDSGKSPSIARLIDHERSLFYAYPGEGVESLLSRVDRLGITPSTTSDTGSHCLLEWIDDADALAEWASHIRDIPTWFIKAVCGEVKGLPLKASEVEAVVDFLTQRKRDIGTLILKHKNRFPMVKQWPVTM